MVLQRLRKNSGQSLLMAIFIGLVLLLSIPVVFFINHINAWHQEESDRRAKGLVIAKEGIAYAKQILGAVWLNTPNTARPPLATLPPECGGNPITGADGSHFKITCDENPPASSYQVHVVSTALWPPVHGTPNYQSVRSLEAYISQKTLAVSLSQDVHASVALELVQAPAPRILGDLQVHWGPISCFDQNTPLNINSTDMKTNHYPRIFSVNGINPYDITPNSSATNSNTDESSFWAFESLGFSPPPNDQDSTGLNYSTGYTDISQNEAAACNQSQVAGGLSAATANCYLAPTTTAIFSAHATPLAAVGTIVYVDGNAEWQSGFALDLGENGAFIVNGNLQLDAPGAAAGNIVTVTPTANPLNVPSTAPLEYTNSGAFAWPCKNTTSNGTCLNASTGPTVPLVAQFRGFLWVKGNLTVNGVNNTWALSGVVLVGDPAYTGAATPNGTLQIAAGNSLTIYYDDQVNRSIRVGYQTGPPAQVLLQSDSVRDIPAAL